jgi:uncharacterized protein involved in response to NO
MAAAAAVVHLGRFDVVGDAAARRGLQVALDAVLFILAVMGGRVMYAVRYWPVLSRPRVDGRPG